MAVDFSNPSTFPRPLRFFIEAMATAGFVGRIPFAPGSWGTLWGVPIGLLLLRFGPLAYMGATLVLIGLAIVVSELYERLHGGHDSKEIVIDEVVGYLVAFTWLPPSWVSIVAAFVVFRIFDILKPYPISWLDKKVRGGLGVVIDDVAAGLVANVLLQVGFHYWGGPGVSLAGHLWP